MDKMMNTVRELQNMDLFFKIMVSANLMLSLGTKRFAEVIQTSRTLSTLAVLPPAFWDQHLKLCSLAACVGVFVLEFESFQTSSDTLLNDLSSCDNDCDVAVRADSTVESESFIGACAKSRENVRGVSEFIASLPVSTFAEYVGRIFSERTQWLSHPNEPSPQVTKIGELMLHFPVQLENIMEICLTDGLISAFNLKKTDKGCEDSSKILFKHILKLHLSAAVGAINVRANETLRKVDKGRRLNCIADYIAKTMTVMGFNDIKTAHV